MITVPVNTLIVIASLGLAGIVVSICVKAVKSKIGALKADVEKEKADHRENSLRFCNRINRLKIMLDEVNSNIEKEQEYSTSLERRISDLNSELRAKDLKCKSDCDALTKERELSADLNGQLIDISKKHDEKMKSLHKDIDRLRGKIVVIRDEQNGLAEKNKKLQSDVARWTELHRMAKSSAADWQNNYSEMHKKCAALSDVVHSLQSKKA